MPRRMTACGRRPTMLRPSTSISPEVGRRNPVIRLNTVVLPAPLGPMSPRISPASTVKEKRSTARSPPKSRVRSLTVRSAMAPRSPAPRPGSARAAPYPLGQVADDQHHEETIEDQVADLEALAEELPDGGEKDGADDGADHGGEAADHRDEHHLHRDGDREDGVRI